MILFQIKIYSRNTKETMLARYFIKVNARPNFMRLRVIRRMNKSSLKTTIENKSQRFGCISLFKPPRISKLNIIYLIHHNLFKT